MGVQSGPCGSGYVVKIILYTVILYTITIILYTVIRYP